MQVPRKPLILAALVGLTGNASLATLTIAQVPFSIFPWIAFVLAVYQLYQSYLQSSCDGAMPLFSGACFLLGALGYSVFMRVQHPQIGSDLVPLFICLALLCWLAVKLGWFRRHKGDDNHD